MYGKKFNREKGKLGEDLAVKMLLRKGYEIIARNYSCKIGEIDIIARHNEYIVFVEVKLRQDMKNGSPSEAVDFRKQKKIIKTAKAYISYNKLFDHNFRFDVVEILLYKDKPLGRIIENAFWE